MVVHNADIARMLDEIADLIEIDAGDPFRVRAYRNAARAIGECGRSLQEMVDQEEDLRTIQGVGERIAAHVREILARGSTAERDELLRRIPLGICELIRLPGLGPKRARILYDALKIESLDQLRQAIEAGRLQGLRGFGEKTIATLLEKLKARTAAPRRLLFSRVGSHAQSLVDHLRRAPGVREVVVAGSFRRAKETVGDLDVLATTDRPAAVMDRFLAFEGVRSVSARGPTRSTVVLHSGLQVDLRVVRPESLGAALHYFTGSKAHNIEIRRLGAERGLKINEYGVFRRGRRAAGETEESVFKAVGLPWIPPELREMRGEIEAAREERLPNLVTVEDLRGDLHSHTRASDGHATLEQMAEAAAARRLEYLAITEHSPRLAMAGLKPREFMAHIDRIDRLNARLRGVTLLKGIEVDILDDGALDMTEDVLERLDVVLGAVHSRFNLPREAQTERILRAMDHPRFMILAHPSGRLLGRRDAYDVDMPRLIRHARDRGCFLELDGQPDRLDLDDVYCQMARAEGVLVSLDSDAHSVAELAFAGNAVNQARRGWLEKGDVLNARPLTELRRMLERAGGRGGSDGSRRWEPAMRTPSIGKEATMSRLRRTTKAARSRAAKKAVRTRLRGRSSRRAARGATEFRTQEQ